MAKKKKIEDDDFEVWVGTETPREDSPELEALTKAHFEAHVANRTEQRKIKNELLSIQYKMEEYLDSKDIQSDKYISLQAFLTEFLKVLDLSFKNFAITIDSTDANLKKYLNGDRKFNTELAMKFGNFFHTNPELWLKLHVRNEFIQLNAAKKNMKKYAKYDYEKQLPLRP